MENITNDEAAQIMKKKHTGHIPIEVNNVPTAHNDRDTPADKHTNKIQMETKSLIAVVHIPI